MKSQSISPNRHRDKAFQTFKLIIYALLTINFVYYIFDDWGIAVHTMRDGGSFLKWTGAFAATIDVAAWLTLILMFELETYLLSDEALEGFTTKLLHAIRYACYLFICHSLYAYGNGVINLLQATVVPDVTNLCQLAGQDLSYVRNLGYTTLTQDNCAMLSDASRFYYTEPGLVVTDSAGLQVERNLAWIDFLEVVVWLFILLTIEVMVRLQDRGMTKGTLISCLNLSKIVLYFLLWVAIAYWMYKGHYVYAWDEFVWIAGFVMIEVNMLAWRKEIIMGSFGESVPV